MPNQTIEGTWEEILQYAPQLSEQNVRLTILTPASTPSTSLDQLLKNRVGELSFDPTDLSDRTHEAYDFSQGKRGAIDPLPADKTRITIRLDDDILDWFREQVTIAGGNCQTQINEVLRQHIQENRQHNEESLEEILRRVVREEIQRVN
jgi:uncharacterized protein (DUF4415 family)